MTRANRHKQSVTQRTLKEVIAYVGVGLHTGRKVSMVIKPAWADSGIRFVRADAPIGSNVIPAYWHNVIDTQLCTVLGNEHGYSVATVEHLLAALRGCGIDNAEVELDGPEIPIMDGSAHPFVSMIERVGTLPQVAQRKAIVIHRSVEIHKGEKFAILMPHPTPRITVEIDFPSKAVGSQKLSVDLVNEAFKQAIAPARTFGFVEDVKRLRAEGLAIGGSLRNAILIDGDQIMNDEGLRFANEFVRHKILDCFGDLSLAGAPIIGHFYALRPGHKLNNAFVRQLFAEKDAWSYVSLSNLHGGRSPRRLLSEVETKKGRKEPEADVESANFTEDPVGHQSSAAFVGNTPRADFDPAQAPIMSRGVH